MAEDNNYPYVSVIVPAYNDEKRIELLIQCLLKQTYPKDRYEIIIVDNGSKDETKSVIQKYPVTLFEQKEIQSSYAARNAGILRARGEIIAFTDSDCQPVPEWLEKGVAGLTGGKADMAGGRVCFIYSAEKSAAEYWDSVTSMQNQISVRERQVSTTANLFVRKPVFDAMGLFPEVKTGGDVQWTGKASRAGYKIVYAAEAVVHHPARNFKQLLKKSIRVGSGYIRVWKSQQRPLSQCIREFLGFFIPPKINRIKNTIAERGTPEMEQKLLRIWGVSYLCAICTGLGISIRNSKYTDDRAV